MQSEDPFHFRDTKVISTPKLLSPHWLKEEITNRNSTRLVFHCFDYRSVLQLQPNALDTIETLSVRRVTSDGPLYQLLEYLADLPRLTSLSISSVSIYREWGHLLPVLNALTNLSELSLCLSPPNDQFFDVHKTIEMFSSISLESLSLDSSLTESQAIELVPHFTILTGLRVLNLNSCFKTTIQPLCDALPALTQLQSLSLRNCTLPTTDWESLAKQLSLSQPDLKRLYLSTCGLVPENMMALCDGLKLFALEKLDLTGNSCWNRGVSSICNLLGYSTRLQSLYLQCCQFDDRCMDELCSALSNLYRLDSLRLDYNHLTEAGCNILARAIPHLPHLRILSIRNICKNTLKDTDLHGTLLSHINLCKFVTDEHILGPIELNAFRNNTRHQTLMWFSFPRPEKKVLPIAMLAEKALKLTQRLLGPA